MTDTSAGPDSLSERVQNDLGTIADPSVAPVDKWNPQFSGDVDIRVARNGQWLYNGNPMERQALVKLFSTILRRDDDGHYYLVTPVEKWRIQVEDAPFVAHSLEREGTGSDQALWLTTNVGERVPIDREHLLRVEVAANGEEPAPYVRVRRNLDALVERQAFYELAALAVEGEGPLKGCLGVYSKGDFYPIGKVE